MEYRQAPTCLDPTTSHDIDPTTSIPQHRTQENSSNERQVRGKRLRQRRHTPRSEESALPVRQATVRRIRTSRGGSTPPSTTNSSTVKPRRNTTPSYTSLHLKIQHARTKCVLPRQA